MFAIQSHQQHEMTFDKRPCGWRWSYIYFSCAASDYRAGTAIHHT